MPNYLKPVAPGWEIKPPQLPTKLDSSPFGIDMNSSAAKKVRRQEKLSNFKTGVNDLVSSEGFQGAMGAIGNVVSSLPSMDKSVNTTDEAMQNVRNSANKALMSGALGPWGMAAGAINSVIDKTGGFTDASKGLGGANDTLNSIASLAIPGAGWFTKKTDAFAVDDTLKNSSGYTGTANDANRVAGNAGAKLLFGRKKANRQIADMKDKQNLTTNILDQNKTILDAAGGNANDIEFNNQFKNMGGWNQGAVQFGQDGMKVKDLAMVKKIARSAKKIPKKELEQLVAKRAKGGTLEKQGEEKIGEQSVIPGGALHARKHNLKDVDKDLAKQVTHKGVPVVTFETGGEVDQHAEIERGEIIFRKEVTEELEKLWKDGSEEAVLKAGKLIANEIINNTIDKSEEYEIED